MTTLTADGFFDGLISALTVLGYTKISIRNTQFDKAIEKVFKDLKESQKDTVFRFRIRSHPVHGDSKTLRTMISHAAQRGTVSLDNPEFLDIRFKLNRDNATSHMESLPLPATVFKNAAKDLVQNYDLVT